MLGSITNRGLLYSVGIIVNRIIPEHWFRFRIFRVFELAPAAERRSQGEQRSVASASDELSFRWCQTDEDFAAANRLTYYSSPQESIAADAPKSACLAIDWAEPVGGVWLAQQCFDESDLGLHFQLADDQQWLFAAFVAKSHRRKGIYRKLVNHVLQDQSLRTFASINPTNKASIAAHTPFIRRTAGTCVAVRIFGWANCWATAGLKIQKTDAGNAIQISGEST
ncbi:hypothetical protein [Rubripirellula lacrimiformis]|nr:hypothetical protein [Rubripirellula lacrimiformis]